MDEQNQSAQSDCFCHGAGPRFTNKAREFHPGHAAEHFRTAAVEVLKGVRHLLDTGISYLSHEPGARGTTVNVE
jgi:hypothetical protein